jgi:HD-GYP domain-containing protein (c-di-GMP phosphodiesterase class II)
MKGACLHDLGKISISDTILLKPGKLSPEEYEIIKTHPRHGAEIIVKYAWLQDAMDVVKHHHEKFNGSGYPTGLSCDSIPRAARIFTIIDVFDALTSPRPYREPLLLDRAMAPRQGKRCLL